jgi:rhodanese-related sulfurtransferase
MRQITRTELKAKIDSWENLKLVFTLGEWQYRSAHIPGSLNLPCSRGLFASADALKDLDRDDEIVVYCSNEACFASILVYHLLEKRGYRNVSRYAGGLLDWEQANYPLEGEMAIAH